MYTYAITYLIYSFRQLGLSEESNEVSEEANSADSKAGNSVHTRTMTLTAESRTCTCIYMMRYATLCAVCNLQIL